jgi:hypothetical protein
MSLSIENEIDRIIEASNKNKDEKTKIKLSESQESKIREFDRRFHDFEKAYENMDRVCKELKISVTEKIKRELDRIVR